ncbi:adenomatous polyposis coli protein 2 [Elysia marginata]|uniref:Adenomatous polyposis coli protein 2 n=1 Tax=Elysia marginata TaxID=1093978 RepID=A0AAV4FRH1_9GAST|nr:adenomatous polyposis coli protein 2 [Elysia marginata]
MAMSSYDELLKQVASLKTENNHLRKELKDNSSHLTKLENDASNMKDVLSHIQGTLDEPVDLGVAEGDDTGDLGKETGAEGYAGDITITNSINFGCEKSSLEAITVNQAQVVKTNFFE